jgi:hypothetical protein
MLSQAVQAELLAGKITAEEMQLKIRGLVAVESKAASGKPPLRFAVASGEVLWDYCSGRWDNVADGELVVWEAFVSR